MVKQKFSKKWKASKQPRKQRKYIYNAPLHIRRNFLASTLSKELRGKYGMRNIEIRKNDEVKIMRGKYKKKQGKVNNVNAKNLKVAIEGIQRTKKDGTKINVWFNPSNLRIIVLNTDDKKRFKRVNKETKPTVPSSITKIADTKMNKKEEIKNTNKKPMKKSGNKKGEKKDVQK